MDVKKSEIAEEISRLCEERNITSYELAKRSGLQESSVRNMFQKGTTSDLPHPVVNMRGSGTYHSTVF